LKEIRAQFSIDRWDEIPFDDVIGGAKLTHANVTKAYKGGIEGTSLTQWLMVYEEDGTAGFVGMERIVGTLDDKQGSLVLQHDGEYNGAKATGELIVVSGTNELNGVTGKGSFLADPAGSVTLELNFR
jgi:hypothetical protein